MFFAWLFSPPALVNSQRCLESVSVLPTHGLQSQTVDFLLLNQFLSHLQTSNHKVGKVGNTDKFPSLVCFGHASLFTARWFLLNIYVQKSITYFPKHAITTVLLKNLLSFECAAIYYFGNKLKQGLLSRIFPFLVL